MFLKNTAYFLFILLTGLVLSACKKAPNYPKEPVIAFKELKVVHNYAELVDSISILVTFQDGDGDLGNDPVVSSHQDFFVDIYKKKNGVYSRIGYFDTMQPNYNAYLPLLSPYNITGPIDGTITNIVPPFQAPIPGSGYIPPPGFPFAQYDTIKFQVRIRDRADNYSNWVETSEYIIWDKFDLED